MTPQDFEASNGTLLGGDKWSEPVSDLPVFRDGEMIFSCWRMTWRERLSAILGRPVWLTVLAPTTHAPVALRCGKS